VAFPFPEAEDESREINIMRSTEDKSKLATQLVLESIDRLSDEEISGLATERPGHSGQYGFILNPDHFDSEEHLSKVSAALMKRLMMVDNLDEIMKRIKER